MIAWIMGNIATIIICAVLIAVVTLIVVGMRKDRKKGKSSCGGDCAHCGCGCSHSATSVTKQ